MSVLQYLPVAVLTALITLRFLSLFEREICVLLLCWLEVLVENRAMTRPWRRYFRRGAPPI
jgi:hypothetical protein